MRPNSRPGTPRELVAAAAARLTESGVPTPLVDARLIAAHLLGVRPLEVAFTEPEGEAAERFARDFDGAIARRAHREPLQHIIGTAPFGELTLTVGPGVFIPRPETEVLAAWAIERLAGMETGMGAEIFTARPTVVDLGTGSGALAIAIARAHPNAQVIAVERSETARHYAEGNAAGNGTSISIVPGDMTDPELLRELDGRVDLIVANPPYVPETGELEPEVYRDPHEAVFSGADGMEAIRGLVPVAARLLAPGGWLGIEHDDTTSLATQELLLADGHFTGVSPLNDLTDRARFVTASKVGPYGKHDL
ncbi:peptide chain release factor N(5)-glutamine methyltransferase [Corynebacterium sp. CNCTC7651]|uniref:peptide chain release factor N(5)-glutamine methyltransferase n=1 Tax=Corynebacterium sp. CNCTC7651 TaxID=2815361 RepID=UPI001F4926DA|nr:peptide chain release factor N(5)-glutamine methyltransferase [Corynebacterium sp. CNCTC7651]UIZ92963.1 peptide chain release factor N(5)-glutamine methyltransferase [Corynebacterium sp. CNCTC7651]